MGEKGKIRDPSARPRCTDSLGMTAKHKTNVLMSAFSPRGLFGLLGFGRGRACGGAFLVRVF